MFNLLKHFNADRKASISVCYGANPTWTPSNYLSLVSEGFQKNVFVYRAISLISGGIASIPISVKNQDLSDHKLTQLFARPNEFQGRSAFMSSVVNYLLLSGNAFIHYDGKEMCCLRPDRVTVILNNTKNKIDKYIYEVDGVKFSLKEEEVLHLKFFNPTNDWSGFAPIQAANQATDQYNEMAKHNISILQNGGRPSGCLILKNNTNLTDEQRSQLVSDINEAYGGARNVGKIMVLEGGFEWKEMGLTPKDLDFESSKNFTAREIVQAFGVPPILVGIKGDSAFNNYKEARTHFWEDTVLPLAEFIRTEFSHWFSKKYDGNPEVVFDIDSIPALIGKREMLWNKISNADFLTVDEKRELLGFPKLKEGK